MCMELRLSIFQFLGVSLPAISKVCTVQIRKAFNYIFSFQFIGIPMPLIHTIYMVDAKFKYLKQEPATNPSN